MLAENMEKPTSSKPSTCLNCQAPVDASAQFCSACGQKQNTGRIRFGQLFADFLDNFFNFDSRTFLSLRKLLHPGFLTQEYFRGRHRSYLNPLRLFLISTLIMVATISWKINDGIRKSTNYNELLTTKKTQRDVALKIDKLRLRYAQVDRPDSLAVQLDSLTNRLLRTRVNGNTGDSVDIDRFMTIGTEDFPPIYINDVLAMSIEGLVEKYEIQGWKNQFVFQQKMKMVRDGPSFLRYLIGRISWAVLMLIPLLALSLKLFYIRRSFYYVEHFIFSIHVHGFVFLLVTLQLLLLPTFPLWTIAINMLWLTIYLALAMKRFYDQSWSKTLLKFCILAMFVYWMLISIAAVFAIVLGVLFF